MAAAHPGTGCCDVQLRRLRAALPPLCASTSRCQDGTAIESFTRALPIALQVWLVWSALIGPLLLYSQRRRRPGLPRLLATAPIIAINLSMPFLFDGESEVLTNFTVAVATSMLTNLKVLTLHRLGRDRVWVGGCKRGAYWLLWRRTALTGG